MASRCIATPEGVDLPLMKAYDEDLAYIHHTSFGDFSRGAAPFLLRTLRDAGVTRGRIVDLGCGSGIWARELTRAGFQVLGIDVSPAMIAIARRTAPKAEFRIGPLRQADLGRCDTVTALGEVLNYRLDPRTRLSSLAPLLRRIHTALRPGGLLVFDVAGPGRGDGPRHKHFEGRDWTIVLEVDEDAARRRLKRRIVTFRKVGQLYRRAEETHELQLYRRATVLAALREAGFQARTISSYGEQALPWAVRAFIARKE